VSQAYVGSNLLIVLLLLLLPYDILCYIYSL